MRPSSFPWCSTLLVTFINVFVANRRRSPPKTLISALPENIDFFFLTRITERGRGKKTAQSKKEIAQKNNLAQSWLDKVILSK